MDFFSSVLEFFQSVLGSLFEGLDGLLKIGTLLPTIFSFFNSISKFVPGFVFTFLSLELAITFFLILVKRRS